MKKDYRLYCLLLYTVSPSEVTRGRYKAGCKMARHELPSKRCRNCKYGIDTLDERLVKMSESAKELGVAMHKIGRYSKEFTINSEE